MPIDPNTGAPLPYDRPAPQPMAPPQPQPGGQPGQVPPELAGHVDTANPLQMMLLQRVAQLSEQDAEQFFTGIKPQALAVLKKVLPELGFILDAMMQQMSGAPNPAMQPPGGAPQQPGAPGMDAMRPMSKLSAV